MSFRTALALFGLCVCAFAAPHGGTYRGPGSTVPPGGGGGGPSTPIGPGGSSVTEWNVWWSFNRDPYLQLKQAIRGAAGETGDDEFFLGLGQTKDRKAGDPEEVDLRDRVVPAILDSLDGSKNQDLITAGLMALAKIGLDPTDGQPLQAVFESYLSHSNQEIAETAAVALGLLGREDSALDLVALMGDTERGRELVERKEVPYRTRAFAAYGLGQLGHASTRSDVRSFAVFHLAAALEADNTPTRDLGTACILSYGLVPLAIAGEWPRMDESTPRPNGNRESQIAWLLNWFSTSKSSDALRLHAPVALARLCRGAGELPKRAVATVLLTVLAAHGDESRDVQRASVIALGRLGDDDGDELDARIRDKLRKLFSSKDAMSRDLARIALARVVTQPGNGTEPGVSFQSAQSWFLQDLVTGKSTSRPWTVFALGVLAHRRVLANKDVPPAVTSALRHSLAKTSSPRDVVAICSAIGLSRDQTAIELLMERAFGGADDAVRSTAAVALGMIGAREAIEGLQATVAESASKPLVVREFATALALLGDRAILKDLVENLRDSKTFASQSALAFAIGRVGDARAIDPLLEILADRKISDATRAFAIAALGVVGHAEELPWNSNLAVDLYYGLPPATLTDGARGVLDLL